MGQNSQWIQRYLRSDSGKLGCGSQAIKLAFIAQYDLQNHQFLPLILDSDSWRLKAHFST
jgi:hypothetical protein